MTETERWSGELTKYIMKLGQSLPALLNIFLFIVYSWELSDTHCGLQQPTTTMHDAYVVLVMVVVILFLLRLVYTVVV